MSTTARLIATQFPDHGCMDDLTTERSFVSQATWVIDVLGLFFLHVINGDLKSQTLADVLSNGEGNTCVYCKSNE